MESRHKQDQTIQLVLFFVISFLISWSIWVPAGIWTPEYSLLVLPGAWASTIAALLLTGITTGKERLKKILKSLIHWRVKPRYYLFAIFAVLEIAILTIIINLYSVVHCRNLDR